MTLPEAFVKSIKDQALGIAWTVPGKDAIKLSLAGPRLGKVERGLELRVDVNVGYHVFCTDPATVASYHGLRRFGETCPNIDLPAMLDLFDANWCDDNEHLEANGHGSVQAAAQAAWRLGELAVALQGAAYVLGLWDPSETAG